MLNYYDRSITSSELITLSNIPFRIKPIKSNIHTFKKLNLLLLPVHYNDRFYMDIEEKHPIQLCKLVYYETEPIAAISCRKEVKDGIPFVYVMTLGVLPRFRRLGIGIYYLQASLLIERIVRECEMDPNVDQVCLHVHVGNQNALNLYLRFGFEIESTLYGYYASNPGVEPPDAYYLCKTVRT